MIKTIFTEYRDSIAYLDIETTGLSRYKNIITTIALWDGKDIKYYINGENLDDFKEDIKSYRAIVTYNGSSFDLPFIEHFFNIKLDNKHLDIMYPLRKLGFKGGLKSCEKQLGLVRKGALKEVDGYTAVLLWKYYKETGDRKALETLVAYNIEDAINLYPLTVKTYNMSLFKNDLDLEPVYEENLPEIPFSVDGEVLKKIRI